MTLYPLREGDRVAGYLPNIPEAGICMLATTSIGAIWSSCSPDFGKKGVLDRFQQIGPKLMFATDAYVFKGQRIDLLGKLKEIVLELDTLERCVKKKVL